MQHVFAKTGNQSSCLWLVSDSPEFGVLSGGVAGIKEDTPIYLKVGNASYGETHIRNRHFHWVTSQGFDSVPHIVHFKLCQPGEIYSTETDSKLKIVMRLRPSAMLVMELIENPHDGLPAHLSITTLYFHQGSIDGLRVGRYLPTR